MPAAKGKITCPVCGMAVDESTGFKAGLAGQTYYFCSEEDKKEFLMHPSLYTKKREEAA